jgi:hypothetical protein
MTTDELVSFGKDADYWIFPSDEWDTTYQMFGTQLDTMKSVQNKQVYDYQASGQNAWFEQRFAEYFAVLQDFCSVVGKTTSLTGKSWFRNTLNGTPVGSLGVNCTENSRVNAILPLQGTVCEDLSVLNNATTIDSGAAGNDTAVIVVNNGTTNDADSAKPDTANSGNSTTKDASESSRAASFAVAAVVVLITALIL